MIAIRSTRVVTPGGVGPATILIDGQTISSVQPPEAGSPVHATDFGDLVISPGLVDSHVHVNEPGRTEWEGYVTATRAAAAGGITTIVDMPLNSIPSTTTVQSLRQKIAVLEGQCRVDVALWGGVVPGNTSELRPMTEAGVRGFKCFLIDSGVTEFPHVSAAALREAARELAALGVPLLVHAELAGPIDEAQSHVAGQDPVRYWTYLASRPPAAEEQAIALLVEVARETGARIHIVHLSASSALEIIRRARHERLPLTAETTPHYLHLEAEHVPPGRFEFKCAPPIRDHENRERLWRGLSEGLIDMIVSDHSPCVPELKRGDFMKAWGGISSMQFVLPIVWTEAKRRGHSLGDVARWTSAAPAQLAGLSRKGAIAPGYDADFVIWSPERATVVSAEDIEHRHKLTPYAGETLFGVVDQTWLRGEPVYAKARHVGDPRGKFCR